MIRKIIFCAMCALALVACKKGIVVPQGEIVYSITGDYSELTSNSVTISCSSYTGQFSEVDERGVWYSTNPDLTNGNNCYWAYAWGGYDKQDYTVKIDVASSTTYYYRSFVRYRRAFNSQYHFGEVKSFTTPPAE